MAIYFAQLDSFEEVVVPKVGVVNLVGKNLERFLVGGVMLVA